MAAMFSRLGLRLKKQDPDTRKVNVVLMRGEGLGLRYEWKAGSPGPEVMDVAEGHAAQRSGLRTGDVIYSISGQRTANGACMVSVIERMKERGGCFEIEVMRTPADKPKDDKPATSLRRTKPRSATQPPGSAADYISLYNPSTAGSDSAPFFARSLTKPLLKAGDGGVKVAKGSITPKLFEVVCPTQPDIEGTYHILPNTRINSAPMWGGTTGKRLYCTKSGLWALVDCVDGPQSNIALVSSRFPSRGRMPHVVHWADWQCWDGTAWIPAPVRIEELRIDTVDGRPYWKGAFIEYYGPEKGQERWSAAAEESNVFVTDDDELPELCAREITASPASLPSFSDSTYEPPSLSSVMFGENESIISTAMSVQDVSALSAGVEQPSPVACDA